MKKTILVLTVCLLSIASFAYAETYQVALDNITYQVSIVPVVYEPCEMGNVIVTAFSGDFAPTVIGIHAYKADESGYYRVIYIERFGLLMTKYPGTLLDYDGHGYNRTINFYIDPKIQLERIN